MAGAMSQCLGGILAFAEYHLGRYIVLEAKPAWRDIGRCTVGDMVAAVPLYLWPQA